MTSLSDAVRDRLGSSSEWLVKLAPKQRDALLARIAVEESTLDTSSRLLFLVLQPLSGSSWPMRELGHRCQLGESTVRQKVKTLRTAGWLRTERDPRHDTLRFWTMVPWDSKVPDETTWSARIERGSQSDPTTGPLETGGLSVRSEREHREEHNEIHGSQSSSSLRAAEVEGKKAARGLAADGINATERRGLRIERPALLGTWNAAGFIIRVLKNDHRRQAVSLLNGIDPSASTGEFRNHVFTTLGLPWEEGTPGAGHVISAWGSPKRWHELDLEFERRILTALFDQNWGYLLNFGPNDPYGRTPDDIDEWLDEIECDYEEPL